MMVLYHIVFDLHEFHNVHPDPMSTGWRLFALLTATLFLLLVGTSFELSKHRGMARKWKRIGTIAFYALIITGMTYVWDPFTYIRFGILHCIAVSIILLTIIPQNKVIRIGIILAAIGMGQVVPFMRATHGFFIPLGIRPNAFITLDYFPLLPWFGVVLIGALITHQLTRHMHTYTQINGRTVHVLAFPGRHALLLYVLHQPIIIGILHITLK